MRITVTFFFLCLPLSTPTTHNTKHAETQGNSLEHNFVLYSFFFAPKKRTAVCEESTHTHTRKETSAAVLSSTDVSRGGDIAQKKKTQRVCGEVRCFKSPHYSIEISFAWERHMYYVATFFLLLLVFFFSTFLSVSLRDLRQQCTTLTETNKSSLFLFDCFFFISCCFERERKKKACVLYYCYYYLS